MVRFIKNAYRVVSDSCLFSQPILALTLALQNLLILMWSFRHVTNVTGISIIIVSFHLYISFLYIHLKRKKADVLGMNQSLYKNTPINCLALLSFILTRTPKHIITSVATLWPLLKKSLTIGIHYSLMLFQNLWVQLKC
jgi:hypothetical protein